MHDLGLNNQEETKATAPSLRETLKQVTAT